MNKCPRVLRQLMFQPTRTLELGKPSSSGECLFLAKCHPTITKQSRYYNYWILFSTSILILLIDLCSFYILTFDELSTIGKIYFVKSV